MKLLITNVAYGDIYANLWCTQHLKSFLDESNIPAVKDRVEYVVFTDGATLPKLNGNENFQRLRDTIPTEIFELKFPDGLDEAGLFNGRYDVLVQTFKISVQKAIERKALLSAIVADLVCARGFLPKILSFMDEGYGSVFMQPPRCAADSVVQELDKYPRAMHAEDLWKICYQNMHPLWVACHWHATQFTKLPFQLLWNSGQGIACHSFSITPIVFKPLPSMLERRGMIDGDIPELCEKPYWCTDWTDAPVMGVEPLFCYYPPFANHTATTEWVKKWAKACLHPSQFEVLKHRLFYPNKEEAGVFPEHAEKYIQEILR